MNRQSALAVWQQIPVANRTVEVNTKTGFSLTAGSYSVRASSTASGQISLAGVTSATATISSVTTTRAVVHYLGQQTDTDSYRHSSNLTLTNATTVTASRADNVSNVYTNWNVLELF